MNPSLERSDLLGARALWTLFAGITAVHLLGMWLVPVLEVDSAQYASIAREMAETDGWLVVKHRGADYLDKPPLLFWSAAALFKIFGPHHFLFRLPAFLATLLGVYAVWRMAWRLYGPEAAAVAALTLYGSQAWYLMVHDLRADTMLAAAVAVATWQLWEYLETGRRAYWLGGFTALALALMAKGPIGAAVPAMALGAHLLANGRWRDLFRPAWLLGALWVMLLLSPMLWGLWRQFGTDGWYFFFWKQSFGRITGENEWKNDSGFGFLWHTFLWAFLPGSLAVAAALVRVARSGRWAAAALPVAGFLLPLAALSFSRYKLPHYGYVAFPFAALLVGEAYLFFREKISEKKGIPLAPLVYQGFLLVLAAASVALLGGWAFPGRPIAPYVLSGAAWLIGVWTLFRGDGPQRVWMPGLWALLSANLWLNTAGYPALLEYQAGIPVARFLDAQPPETTVAYYRAGGHSLDFYFGRLHVADFRSCAPGTLLVTDGPGLEEIRGAGRAHAVLGEWPNFPVSKLNGRFLDPRKRAAQTAPWYVLRLE